MRGEQERYAPSGGGTMQPDAVAEELAETSAHRQIATNREREQEVFRELQRRIHPKDFQHWFQDKVVLQVVEDRLLVGVEKPFLLNWLQKQFRQPILVAAQAVMGPAVVVGFTVDPALQRKVSVPQSPSLPQTPALHSAETAKTANQKPDRRPQKECPPREKERTAPSVARRVRRRFADLADFVMRGENDRNYLPYMAAAQVGRLPGERHNPLFLYGNTGCGKTHLLEGIYRTIRREHGHLRVQYLTAENFTNYFTQAVRKHSGAAFRQRFRTVDVLLLDDVDFFEGKIGTQKELLHTFEELLQKQHQMVLAADRHPRLLTKLLPELASRFASGLTCRVEVPDYETRLEICRRRLEREKADISSEAVRFVARKFRRTVRELQGALNGLITQYEISGRRVDLPTARRVLAEFHDESVPDRNLNAETIEQTVCELFGLSPAQLRSATRKRAVTQPRMLAMFLIRKHTQAAYSEIGSHFGGRHHATVMAAEKRVRHWLRQNESIPLANEQRPLSEVLELLEARLTG